MCPGTLGALRAPWGSAFGALGAHGGHWDDSEAIPNGMEVGDNGRFGSQFLGQAAQSIKSQVNRLACSVSNFCAKLPSSS